MSLKKLLGPTLAAIFAAAGIAWAATQTLTLGASTGPGGILTLFGSTSGSATIQTAAVAGTGTLFQLPATNGSNTNVLQTDGSGVTSWVAAGGGSSVAPIPQGRLTLTANTPVMIADATAQTTIRYDTYVGNLYPNWSGSAMVNITITSDEISMGLDSVTPHIASGSLYDVFGTAGAAICAGPAWTSGTTRGTGAGTTELQLKLGVWTNKNSLTHCWGGASGTTDLGAIAANQATLLGTFYATANGQTAMAFNPTPASGGTNNFLGLDNAYNKVFYVATCGDSATWNGNGANTGGPADASNSNRVTFVDSLGQSITTGFWNIGISPPGGQIGYASVGIDLTTPLQNPFQIVQGLGGYVGQTAAFSHSPKLGLHFEQAIEQSTSNGVAFNGSTLSVYRAM